MGKGTDLGSIVSKARVKGLALKYSDIDAYSLQMESRNREKVRVLTSDIFIISGNQEVKSPAKTGAKDWLDRPGESDN